MPGDSTTIAVVGCHDTKGEELAFLRERLHACGVATHIVDTGVLAEAKTAVDTSARDVAVAAGESLESLRRRGDRGHAVRVLGEGAARVIRALHDAGAIDGVIAAGGGANTSIGAAAMRALPVGVPKVLVSTLASGDVRPYVDTKDLTLIHSVVDIAGLNEITRCILSQAAAAVAAMARDDSRARGGEDARGLGTERGAKESSPEGSARRRPTVAATMFGVTTPCVDRARRELESQGFEVIVFHATGTGGRAMEGLIEDGFIDGVLDLTTTELADELIGGVLSAGPRRLRVAAEQGIPQVVSLGALDMANFGVPDSVPERFRSRNLYEHNPQVTLLRTNADECAELGRRVVERLADARAPVKLYIPRRGVSAIDREGQPFHDAHADEALFDAIRRGVRPPVELLERDLHINDEEFAIEVAGALAGMIRARAAGEPASA